MILSFMYIIYIKKGKICTKSEFTPESHYDMTYNTEFKIYPLDSDIVK